MLACPARLYPICVRSEARRTRGRLTGQSSEMLEEYDQKEGRVPSMKNVLSFPSLHSLLPLPPFRHGDSRIVNSDKFSLLG